MKLTAPQINLLLEMDFKSRELERLAKSGDLDAINQYFRQKQRERGSSERSAPSVERQSKNMSKNSFRVRPNNEKQYMDWRGEPPYYTEMITILVGILYRGDVEKDEAIVIARNLVRAEGHEIGDFGETDHEYNPCPINHMGDHGTCVYSCPMSWLEGTFQIDIAIVGDIDNPQGFHYSTDDGRVTIRSETF